MVKPIERILHSGLFGPWDRPDIEGIQPDELPPAINPARQKTWGTDSFEFFPNFTLLFWAPGWYLTYHYWPTAVDKHIFEANLYFVPPTNLRQRLSQELAAVTFKEYAFQDANTLEATQTQIGTRVVTDFPLCDQEILLRHLHMTAHDYVNRYLSNWLPHRHRQRQGREQDGREGCSECLSCPRNSPTWSGSATGACPPRRSATPSASTRRWPRCRSCTTRA